MKLFNWLRGLNKKWYVFLAIVLVIVIGGCVAANVFLERKQELAKSNRNLMVSTEVGQDLLYLEKFDTLKITADQAKELLPMMDQLNSSDAAAQFELAKQIYGKLSPLQYQALEARQPADDNKIRKDENRGDKKVRSKFSEDYCKGNFNQDPKEAALNNVVINLLKARSAEKPQTQNP